MAAKPKLSAASCSNKDALLTTASSRPACVSTAGTRARTWASSARSAPKAQAGTPNAAQSATVCWASVADAR